MIELPTTVTLVMTFLLGRRHDNCPSCLRPLKGHHRLNRRQLDHRSKHRLQELKLALARQSVTTTRAIRQPSRSFPRASSWSTTPTALSLAPFKVPKYFLSASSDRSRKYHDPITESDYVIVRYPLQCRNSQSRTGFNYIAQRRRSHLRSGKSLARATWSLHCAAIHAATAIPWSPGSLHWSMIWLQGARRRHPTGWLSSKPARTPTAN